MRATRVTLANDPFAHLPRDEWGGVVWPAAWIAPPPDAVAARRQRGTAFEARLTFKLDAPVTFHLHVSADQRYRLRLDDTPIGRGPERGLQAGASGSAGVPEVATWHFETWRIDLGAGRHTLHATVIYPDPAIAPAAQGAIRPGFLLATDDGPAVLNTGNRWEVRRLYHLTFTPPSEGFSHRFAGNLEAATDTPPGKWVQPLEVEAATASSLPFGESVGRHVLVPARLPEQLDQPWTRGVVRSVDAGSSGEPFPDETDADAVVSAAQLLAAGGDCLVPAGERRRVLIDWGDYVCGYPAITVQGAGARVRLQWAEALYTDDPRAGGFDDFNARKGNRGGVGGRWFLGKGDTLAPAGEAPLAFESMHWRAGRYLCIEAEAGDVPVRLSDLRLTETRYPLDLGDATFTGDGCPLDAPTQRILHRGLECCTHETFVDCPYYEQLQYTGDTRLTALITLALGRDDRPARKALEAFGGSRTASGLTPCRAPCNDAMEIPGFSLYWVEMLHDLLAWRGHDAAVRAEVRTFMPAARSVLETWLAHRNADGLAEDLPGWCFVDWVNGNSYQWANGCPPGAQRGINITLNLHLVRALHKLADLEDIADEPMLSERSRRLAAATFVATSAAAWDDNLALFRESPGGDQFSEHAQAFALLCGELRGPDVSRCTAALFDGDQPLAPATIYFSFYTLEAAYQSQRLDAYRKRLAFFGELQNRGFKTPPEMPEPSRSDCHAWGSHPLYHLSASTLGLRPTPGRLGEGHFTLRPLIDAPLRATVPLPTGGTLTAELTPDGTGTVRCPADAQIDLPAGVQRVSDHAV